MRTLTWAVIAMMVVAACAPAGAPAVPSTSTFAVAPPSTKPSPMSSPSPVSSLAPGPSPAATPTPHTVFRSLPLRRSAWADDGVGIGITPGSNGTVAVSIARDQGAVIVLYDATGKPRPGWPIEVPRSTWCGVVGFATDGSLRAVCDATDLPAAGSRPADTRMFALDPAGGVLDGWPVQVPEGYSTRVVGSDLVHLVERSVGDGEWDGGDPDEVLSRSWLIRVAADGTMSTGTGVDETVHECWGIGWSIGPDGIAYGASESSDPPGACFDGDARTRESMGPSQMHALALDGAVGGWPLPIDGAVSDPAFGRDGAVVASAGTYDRPVTRIYAIDPRTRRSVATSPDLPVLSATLGFDSDCGTSPSPPLVAPDGTVYLMDFPTIYAFGPTLRALSGWPKEVPGYLVSPNPPDFDGLTCDWGVGPVAGPDGTLYLSLEPASKSRGGRLDAVAKNGKRPAGWPVKLNRAGSKFWDVAVGEDGAVYALAVEPEAKQKASATLLAIDPDSDVRYSVTLLEP